MNKIVNVLLEKGGVIGQGFVSLNNFFYILISAKVLGLEAFAALSVVWLIYILMLSIHGVLYTQPLNSWDLKLGKYKLLGYLMFAIPLLLALFSYFILWSVSEFYLSSEFDVVLSSIVILLLLVYESIRRFCYHNVLIVKALCIDFSCFFIRFFSTVFVLFEVDSPVVNDLLVVLVIGTIPMLVGIGAHRSGLTRSNVLGVGVLMHYYSYVRWLFGDVVLQWLGPHSVNVIVGAVLGEVYFSMYRLVITLSGVLNVFLQGIENYIPSKVLKTLQESGVDKAWDSLRLEFKVLVAPVSFVLVLYYFICFFSLEWLGIEEVYLVEMRLAIFIALVSMMFKVVFLQYRVAIRVNGDTKCIFHTMLIVAFVLLLGCYPLVYIFGFLGCLLAGLLSDVVELWFLSRFSKTKTGYCLCQR